MITSSSVKNKNNYFFNLFFKYGLLIPFAFFVLFSNDGEGRVISWISFNFNFQYFVIGLLILITIILFAKSFTSIKFDFIAIVLIARNVTVLLSLFHYDSSLLEFIYSGYFQLTFLTIIYIFAINTNIPNVEEFILKLFKFIVLILTFQVFISFSNALIIGVPFSSIKGWIALPIGKSNFVAMFMSPLVIFIAIKMQKSKMKIIMISLALIGIILTMSDGALLSLILISSLYWYSKIKKVYMKIFVFLIGILFIFSIFVMPLNNLTGTTYNDSVFYSYSITINDFLNGDIDKASSGRMEIYKDYLEKISEKPLFGNGFYLPFTKMNGNAHNFILSELYTSGILGTGLYLISLLFALFNVNKFKENDRFMAAIFFSCLYIVMHSLVEPGILGYKIGLFFWILIALGGNRIKIIKGEMRQ